MSDTVKLEAIVFDIERFGEDCIIYAGLQDYETTPSSARRFSLRVEEDAYKKLNSRKNGKIFSIPVTIEMTQSEKDRAFNDTSAREIYSVCSVSLR